MTPTATSPTTGQPQNDSALLATYVSTRSGNDFIFNEAALQSGRNPKNYRPIPSDVEITPCKPTIRGVEPLAAALVEHEVRAGRYYFGQSAAGLSQQIYNPAAQDSETKINKTLAQKGEKGEHNTTTVILEWVQGKNVYVFDSNHIATLGPKPNDNFKEDPDGESLVTDDEVIIDDETQLKDTPDTDHILVVGNCVLLIDSKAWKEKMKYIMAKNGQILRGETEKPFPGGKVRMRQSVRLWERYIDDVVPNRSVSGMIVAWSAGSRLSKVGGWYEQRRRNKVTFILADDLIEYLDEWYDEVVSESDKKTVNTSLIAKIAVCAITPFDEFESVLHKQNHTTYKTTIASSQWADHQPTATQPAMHGPALNHTTGKTPPDHSPNGPILTPATARTGATAHHPAAPPVPRAQPMAHPQQPAPGHQPYPASPQGHPPAARPNQPQRHPHPQGAVPTPSAPRPHPQQDHRAPQMQPQGIQPPWPAAQQPYPPQTGHPATANQGQQHQHPVQAHPPATFGVPPQGHQTGVPVWGTPHAGSYRDPARPQTAAGSFPTQPGRVATGGHQDPRITAGGVVTPQQQGPVPSPQQSQRGPVSASYYGSQAVMPGAPGSSRPPVPFNQTTRHQPPG